MILNHAPDYREPFLALLARKIDLVVVAQPCQIDGLNPPAIRGRYRYVEIQPICFMGFRWTRGLRELVASEDWDIVCVSANFRQLSRIYTFLRSPRSHCKWIWWGLIYGENESRALRTVKRYMFQKSAAFLVHSQLVVNRLLSDFKLTAVSFNNTETLLSDFVEGIYENNTTQIRLIFVGTYKKRKKIERLISLAERRADVSVRIIGPGMNILKCPTDLISSGRVSIVDRVTGKDLEPHFHWADLVVSPGNLGLMISSAARFGKSIVIDSKSYHGPEKWMGVEAGQPFIDFSDENEVDCFLNHLHHNPRQLAKWGAHLQELAKGQYTVEKMVDTHVDVFKNVSMMPGARG